VTRSHPPTLLTLSERLVRDARLIEPGETLLVAVSGGPDSMALLDVLARLRSRLRVSLVAHAVDHGLRAAASEEIALAEELARRHGVPFAVTRVDVAKGGNLQARARTARLAALREAARRADARRIATGHHEDDRAETVLLRLLRGSGPRGLACLPPCDGDLVRPLLRASRATILEHLARHQVPFAEDPSNADPRFLRSRVRHELLPLLRALSPGIVAHLNGLADDLASLPEGSLPPPLSRAHRTAARTASARGRTTVAVRLSGGREVDVGFADGRFVITEERSPSEPRKR
jgi:tRNA(Ile)-lysidine synthase